MSDNNKVDFKSSQYVEMFPQWTVMDDVVEGTLRLRQEAATYLPPFPKEPSEAYNRRLAAATLFNATEKTLGGLIGLMFRKEPKLGADFPPILVDQYQNIDLQGTAWNVFAKDAARESVKLGKGYLLIDKPQFDPNGKTAADEKAANVRPKWIFYNAFQALNWRTTLINGKEVLQQITFEEKTLEPDGDFGEKPVVRYRTFRLIEGRVEWRLFRREETSKDQFDFILEASGFMDGVNEIPVVEIPKSRKPFCSRKPPLIDLALLNVKHYQQASDYDLCLHINNIPILWAVNRDRDADIQAIGHSFMFDFTEGGALQYAEPSGASIGAARTNLEDLKIEMSLLGLSMVAERQAIQRTATEANQDNAQEESELATITQGVKDALEQASIFHAQLANQPTENLTVDLTPSNELTLTSEEIAQYSDMVFKGQLSLETFWSLLAKGGKLPADFDPEKEKEGLTADPVNNAV